MSDDVKPVDWEHVEKLYRAGIMSLRQIADECGLTEGAIRKRAKRDLWARDLAARIRQRAEELVRKEQIVRTPSTQLNPETENETVEANAKVVAGVLIAQKSRIARHVRISEMHAAELEHQAANKELYEQLGDLLRSPDDKGQDKLNDIYRKAISTGSRIDSHKKAAETERSVIAMEREAFGFDTKEAMSPLEEKFIEVIRAKKVNG